VGGVPRLRCEKKDRGYFDRTLILAHSFAAFVAQLILEQSVETVDLGGKRNAPSIAQALRVVAQRWPNLKSASTAEPVFILAAGWRSGSTLLQRMLMRDVFVWGEPYGHAGVIESLAGQLQCLTDVWPEPHFFDHGAPAEALSQKFIANLYPPVQSLLEAHQQFFLRLFAQRTPEASPGRWGIKEVRLTVDHAHYLRWLFPRCKILLLIRNPYDAFRSYAARRDRGWSWYHRWPDQPVTTRSFADHWRACVSGFLKGVSQVDGLVIKYEELTDARHLSRLGKYLGFPVDQSPLGVNPPDGGPPPQAALSDEDRSVLDEAVGDLARVLGYRPEGGTDPTPSRSLTRKPKDEKTVILVPAYGAIEPECEAALTRLEARGYPVKRQGGFAAVDQVRNKLASDALREGEFGSKAPPPAPASIWSRPRHRLCSAD
jgi:hypothetical protein